MRPSALILLISFVLLPALSACTRPATDATGPEPYKPAGQGCIEGGRFNVAAYGAINARIDWQGPSLQCEGMARPLGEGARLRFAGFLEHSGENQVRNRHALAVILSIPGLAAGRTADALATRVTLIEEDSSRFFSTRETSVCWSDIQQQRPILNKSATAIAERYIISGLTYCVAPVAELYGTASVTLSDMTFNGQINWKADN